MKKVFLIGTLVVLSAIVASAQGFNGFHLRAGVALPMGDFASDKKSKTFSDGHGHAGTGFTAGLKGYIPLSGSFSVAIGADFHYNALQSDYIEDIEDALEASYGSSADYTPSIFINVPIVVGFNYALALSEEVSFYVEAGLGVNISKITDDEISYSYNAREYTLLTEVKEKFGFTYGFEGGIRMSQVNIGMRYNDLGSYKFEGTTTVDTEKTEADFKFDKKLPIRNLSIVLGVTF
jgi:hypothetical protein